LRLPPLPRARVACGTGTRRTGANSLWQVAALLIIEGNQTRAPEGSIVNASPCPPRQELSAYLLGKLPESQLEAVADHLDVCVCCQSALESLQDVQDSLVPQLRGAWSSSPTPDPELQRLLGLAKLLQPQLTPLAEAPAHGPAAAVSERAGSGQLGQYRLQEKIGQGGMGAVYKALHLRLEKLVALKVLPAERLNNPEDIGRFEREMRAVGKLNHPNIVRATDAGEADGVPFLVMELIEGTDLHKLVRQAGPLPVAEACELMRQAAVGLQHAHEPAWFTATSSRRICC
jgi:hypothetical protein